jgi:hypothetical protein
MILRNSRTIPILKSKSCRRNELSIHPKSTVTFASGGQNPFYKKGSGLPKIFYWYGLDTLFFFVPLCVPLWLKLGGGFRSPSYCYFIDNFDIIP